VAIPDWIWATVLLAGVVSFAIAVRQLSLRARERGIGALRSVDGAGRTGPTLRSERWRLSGRPDEIRETRDGTWIPVEFKSGATPPRGPPPSHQIQVLAYALLAEETTGRAPPFGLLRYADGGEFRIPWDAAGRTALFSVMARARRPYRGEARPSRARCARCPWRDACDARAI